MTRSGGLSIQLAAFVAITWALVLWSINNMDQPIVKLMMPMHSGWNIKQVFFVWVMWAVMTVAMMLPSAWPMVRTYQRIVARKGPARGVRAFVAAYLVVWSLFTVGATFVQWALQANGVLSHMLVVKDKTTAGSLLILIGLSQWTTLKDMCLHTCRTPAGFFTSSWRDGTKGAFHMGLRHGVFCVGCCWALMALLFVFGVMNLTAIALITAAVIVEKTMPHGDILARIGGAALVAWGGLLIVGLA
jgi:predicted metal-binding membrane protein